MSFSHKPPVSLAAAFPASEVATSRGVHSGRQRISLSQNRQTAVQSSLSRFTCRAVGFNGDRDINDLSWDSYLGEVTTSEKVEEPPQYVPPLPISAEGICIRDKAESLLYALEKVLQGQLDYDKAQVLCNMLCATVEVQNPVICFRGSDKCSEWLRALMQVQASINLHELYYENDMEDSDKRRIYTVWTANFLEHVRANLSEPLNLSESERNQMSGETMFEMEKSGLVSRISSTWYVLQEDNGASFTKAQDSLYHLLQRTY